MSLSSVPDAEKYWGLLFLHLFGYSEINNMTTAPANDGKSKSFQRVACTGTTEPPTRDCVQTII